MAGIALEALAPSELVLESSPSKIVTDKAAKVANEVTDNALHHIPILGQILDASNWIGEKIGGGIDALKNFGEKEINEITGHKFFDPVKDEMALGKDEKLTAEKINKFLKDKGYDIEKHKDMNINAANELLGDNITNYMDHARANSNIFKNISKKGIDFPIDEWMTNSQKNKAIEHVFDKIDEYPSPEIAQKDMKNMFTRDKKPHIRMTKAGKLKYSEVKMHPILRRIFNKNPELAGLLEEGQFATKGRGFRYPFKVGELPRTIEGPAETSEMTDIGKKIAEEVPEIPEEIGEMAEMPEKLPTAQEPPALRQLDMKNYDFLYDTIENPTLKEKLSGILSEAELASFASEEAEGVVTKTMNEMSEDITKFISDPQGIDVDTGIEQIIDAYKGKMSGVGDRILKSNMVLDSMAPEQVEEAMDAISSSEELQESLSETMSEKEIEEFKKDTRGYLEGVKTREKMSDLYNKLKSKFPKLTDGQVNILGGILGVFAGFAAGALIDGIISRTEKSNINPQLKSLIDTNLKSIKTASTNLTNRSGKQISDNIIRMMQNLTNLDRLRNQQTTVINKINNPSPDQAQNATNRRMLKQITREIDENEKQIINNSRILKRDITTSNRQKEKMDSKKEMGVQNKKIKDLIDDERKKQLTDQPININVNQENINPLNQSYGNTAWYQKYKKGVNPNFSPTVEKNRTNGNGQKSKLFTMDVSKRKS